MRCDSGQGLPGAATGPGTGTYLFGSGCVFHWHYGNFRLSLSDPNAKQSIEFIRDMQRDLPTHPGRWPNALTRATDAQATANRIVSDRACAPLRGTIQGAQCDEYPFASTWEGAAYGPRGVNWDVRLVPALANLRVGGLLSAFYQDQRMMKGWDSFYVEIVP